MSTTHGSASFTLLSDKPWALIAIPLGVVAGLGVVAVLLHSRRNRRRKSRLAVSSDPRVRQALERDLQEAWVRGAATDRSRSNNNSNNNNAAARSMRSSQPPQRGSGGGSARWVRPTTTRWAWARDMLRARAEEGLNELGEAPPPYDGRKRREKLEDGDVERGGGGGGGGERGFELDVLGRLPAADALSEPPAYGEQHGSPRDEGAREAASRTALARPPPAVLPGV